MIILNYDTNDLSAGVAPLEVVIALVELANITLSEVPSLKHVTPCSAFLWKSYIVNTVQDTREKMFQFNNFLKHLCEVNIPYHVHRGFWLDPVDVWSRNGIHPNTSLGRKKYKASLRSAVFKSVEQINDYNLLFAYYCLCNLIWHCVTAKKNAVCFLHAKLSYLTALYDFTKCLMPLAIILLSQCVFISCSLVGLCCYSHTMHW